MPTVDPSNSFSRALAAAGALFFDQRGRVMLVEPTYKDYWDIPGGYVTGGETPRQACVREVAEELGLEIEPGQLLVADWAPSEHEGDKILFVFDGGTLEDSQLATIRLQPSELASYEFVDAETAAQRLIPRLARRVMAAVAARGAGHTVYLEHGER